MPLIKSKTQKLLGTVDDHERTRDYITEIEFTRLFDAARKTRNTTRNQALLMMMFRHGLRCSEACYLQVTDLSLETSHLWVRRLKHGLSTQHPIAGDELRVIRRYIRDRSSSLPWLFVSEHGGQLTRSTVYALVRSIASRASISRSVRIAMRLFLNFSFFPPLPSSISARRAPPLPLSSRPCPVVI